MTLEDEKIAALRAQHVEKLNTVRAELQSARESLSERKVGYDTERDKYERVSRRMLTPLRPTESMPAANHSWLNGEAKKELTQAQSALRQLERQIEALEQDLSKWADEIGYLDRVLAGDKVSSMRLVVPQPKAPVVEFDNILMPKERTA